LVRSRGDYILGVVGGLLCVCAVGGASRLKALGCE
jgi:hypothetical protein